MCCEYLGHLTQSVCEGGLTAQPDNLACMLEIVWPGSVQAISGDSEVRLQESLERSYLEFENLKTSFKHLKKTTQQCPINEG